MIRSFRSKALRRFYEQQDVSKLSVVNHSRLSMLLRALNVVKRPEDLNLPGCRFHPLKGNMSGRFSLTVSGNWRLTFGWDGEDAIDIDLEDYH